MIIEFYVGFSDRTWDTFNIPVGPHHDIGEEAGHALGAEYVEKYFPGREISFVGMYNEQEEEEE